MKSLNQIARKAYAAYVQSAVNQKAADPNLFFNPPPEWCALNVEVQACWIKAVEAVYEEVKHLH